MFLNYRKYNNAYLIFLLYVYNSYVLISALNTDTIYLKISLQNYKIKYVLCPTSQNSLLYEATYRCYLQRSNFIHIFHNL